MAAANDYLTILGLPPPSGLWCEEVSMDVYGVIIEEIWEIAHAVKTAYWMEVVSGKSLAAGRVV